MIRFLLNDRLVETRRPAGELLLDSLRGSFGLPGVKQGCREGDCGACAVLVGELEGDVVRYRAMTSCMMLLGQVEGRHIVTIEGLNLAQGLGPVQRAVAEEGATQCGFCTPGVVVSLTSALCAPGAPSEAELLEAAGGNICRCTGYASFRRAARRLVGELAGLPREAGPRLRSLVAEGVLPASFGRATEELARLADGPASTPTTPAQGSVYTLAGGTDVLVQRRFAPEPGRPHFLERPCDGALRIEGASLFIDAGATFEELKHSQAWRRVDPNALRHLDLVASQLIRERATVGGNIANASPIADVVILLLALDAELELAGPAGGRRLSLAKFFHGYKHTDRRPGEGILGVRVPLAGRLANFEKVSKRERLDIASVNTAASFELAGERFARVRLSAGGVGPVPLLLERSAAGLEGRPLDKDAVRAACRTAMEEVRPISDVRGSAEYKRLLLGRLVLAHFIESFPGRGFEELAS
jgi:xanthine dehydrogenase small subunit